MNHSTENIKYPGFAKLEYQALRPEIEDLLEQCDGCVMHAYKELLKAGRLTMSYGTFRDYVRGDGFSVSRRKTPPKPEPLKPLDDVSELDLDGPGTDFGYDLKSVHQTLVEIGVVGFGYSDFCDYFSESQI